MLASTLARVHASRGDIRHVIPPRHTVKPVLSMWSAEVLGYSKCNDNMLKGMKTDVGPSLEQFHARQRHMRRTGLNAISW